MGQIHHANGIEYRLSKPGHLWIKVQGERMNRTIEKAAVNRFRDELRTHLRDVMNA